MDKSNINAQFGVKANRSIKPWNFELNPEIYKELNKKYSDSDRVWKTEGLIPTKIEIDGADLKWAEPTFNLHSEQIPHEEELKQLINKAVFQACYYLGINRPEVNIVSDIYSNYYGEFFPNTKVIYINLHSLCFNGINSAPFKFRNRLQLKEIKEFVLYTMFHELGHYWHNQRYYSHFNKLLPSYRRRMEIYEYVNHPFERIADKIAYILYRKFIKGENIEPRRLLPKI